MLVYCTLLKFDHNYSDLDSMVGIVARWIGLNAETFVDPVELNAGVRRRLPNGSNLHSISLNDNSTKLFAVSFSHADERVSGRLWTTEIGFRQRSPSEPIECTVLLTTNEVSSRVSSPVQVTRPRVVKDLVEKCSPLDDTPGVVELRLDVESALVFLADVENAQRAAPFVVISPKKDGTYVVMPNRLGSLVLGLSNVVVIPPNANTFSIANILGERYSAWLGGIKVIFPSRKVRGVNYVDVVTLRPDQLENIADEGGSPDSEILSVLTHRLNLPNSWRHISVEHVSREQFRKQLSDKLQQVKGSSETAELVELLSEASEELKAKDIQLDGLKQDYEFQQNELWQREAELDTLKAAFAGRDSRRGVTGQSQEALFSIRDSVSALKNGALELSMSLELVSQLFPERVVVLDSALNAAKNSASFQYRKEALNLLWSLVTSYWESLDSSQPENEARKVFGNNAYAAREAETMSKDGVARRTFTYKGEDIFMHRHLKLGVKDSVAETLRIHFHWDAADKKIVIGHCGKHLDF